MAGFSRTRIILALLICAGTTAFGSRTLLASDNGNNGRGNAYGNSKDSGTTTTSAATAASATTASGKGDPMMTTFDGRTFQFDGKVGSFYNIISERNHQLSMRLKLGQMWDHNGTYMDGIGMRYMNHTVIAELAPDDSLLVILDGQRLLMVANETQQEHILVPAQGKLTLMWQLHRPDIGMALEVTTDMANIVIFVTPSGTLDAGGFAQPAYLNFDAALLGPPAGDMTGIVGDSYALLESNTKLPQPDGEAPLFQGIEADYEMPSYFDTAHKLNRFGVAADISSARRRLSENASLAFPLRFSAGRISRRPST